MQLEAIIRKTIANAKNTGVKEADNIAGISFLYNSTLLRHELLRLCQLNGLAALLMVHSHTLLKFAGANTNEGNAVAVSRVHISLNLKNKGREFLVSGVNNLAVLQSTRLRLRAQLQEFLQKALHAKVCHSRAKEHRGKLALFNLFQVKFIASHI